MAKATRKKAVKKAAAKAKKAAPKRAVKKPVKFTFTPTRLVLKKIVPSDIEIAQSVKL